MRGLIAGACLLAALGACQGRSGYTPLGSYADSPNANGDGGATDDDELDPTPPTPIDDGGGDLVGDADLGGDGDIVTGGEDAGEEPEPEPEPDPDAGEPDAG